MNHPCPAWNRLRLPLIFAVLAVGAGSLLSCKHSAGKGDADSASADSAKISDEMDAWMSEAAALNGLPDDTKKLWVRSGKAWVADFGGMPLWTLPEAGHGSQIVTAYPDSIRLQENGLCAELPASLASWLDRVAPQWKSRQRCSPADVEARLNGWLKEVAGKITALSVGKDAQGRVTSLHLSCSDSRTEFPVGRIFFLRNLQALRLDGCALAKRGADGSTYSGVQYLLSNLPVVSLVLHGVHARLLNLSDMKSLDTLVVEDGDQSWIEIPDRCPIGRESCPDEEHVVPRSIHFSKLPLCDAGEISSLESKGAVFSDAICSNYPVPTDADAESIHDQFLEETGDTATFYPIEEYKKLPEKYLKFKKIAPLWTGAQHGEFSCVRGDDYLSEVKEIGDGWVSNQSRGTIFTQDDPGLPKSLPAFGTDMDAIESELPRMFTRTPHFFVWADGDDVQLILHFDDSKKLDAVWYPSGCWAQGWVDNVKGKHQSDEGE